MTPVDADLRIESVSHCLRREDIHDFPEAIFAECIAFASRTHQVQARVVVIQRGLNVLLELRNVQLEVLGPWQHASGQVALRITRRDVWHLQDSPL